MDAPIPVSRAVTQEVIRAAQEILSGSVGVIEGARKIASLHLYSGHGAQPRDADYALFLEIDSRTTHLPVGASRRFWSAAALQAKDLEIETLEESYRSRASLAAHNLIARLERGEERSRWWKFW